MPSSGDFSSRDFTFELPDCPIIKTCSPLYSADTRRLFLIASICRTAPRALQLPILKLRILVVLKCSNACKHPHYQGSCFVPTIFCGTSISRRMALDEVNDLEGVKIVSFALQRARTSCCPNVFCPIDL